MNVAASFTLTLNPHLYHIGEKLDSDVYQKDLVVYHDQHPPRSELYATKLNPIYLY